MLIFFTEEMCCFGLMSVGLLVDSKYSFWFESIINKTSLADLVEQVFKFHSIRVHHLQKGYILVQILVFFTVFSRECSCDSLHEELSLPSAIISCNDSRGLAHVRKFWTKILGSLHLGESVGIFYLVVFVIFDFGLDFIGSFRLLLELADNHWSNGACPILFGTGYGIGWLR